MSLCFENGRVAPHPIPQGGLTLCRRGDRGLWFACFSCSAVNLVHTPNCSVIGNRSVFVPAPGLRRLVGTAVLQITESGGRHRQGHSGNDFHPTDALRNNP